MYLRVYFTVLVGLREGISPIQAVGNGFLENADHRCKKTWEKYKKTFKNVIKTLTSMSLGRIEGPHYMIACFLYVQ